jgi:hypothetical protein
MKQSVVMPVYNESATLKKVVEKVLSVPVEIELICVDVALPLPPALRAKATEADTSPVPCVQRRATIELLRCVRSFRSTCTTSRTRYNAQVTASASLGLWQLQRQVSALG